MNAVAQCYPATSGVGNESQACSDLFAQREVCVKCYNWLAMHRSLSDYSLLRAVFSLAGWLLFHEQAEIDGFSPRCWRLSWVAVAGKSLKTKTIIMFSFELSEIAM